MASYSPLHAGAASSKNFQSCSKGSTLATNLGKSAHWDIPSSIGHAGKGEHFEGLLDRPGKDEDFEELLNRLRSAHTKVCAQNVRLELELRKMGKERIQDHELSHVPEEESKVTPLPLAGVAWNAREAHPPAIGRSARTPIDGRTPRVETPKDPDIRLLVAQLAKQQEAFNGELMTMLSKKDAPRSSIQGPMVANRLDSNAPKDPNAPRQSVSSVTHDSSDNWDKTKSATSKSKFAVSSGNTKDMEAASTRLGTSTSTGLASVFQIRVFLKELLATNHFIAAYSITIMSYAVFIGIETELLATDPTRESTVLTVIHIVYSFVFSIELLIRLGADGWLFFYGPGAILNWLDVVLVFSVVVDLVLEVWSANLSTMATAGPVMRTLRIFRVVRTMRLVRTFHHLHEFQKMAFALASSFKTLVCSMLLVCFVMFFFAVVFTQSAADEGLRDKIQDLQLRYGSLGGTVYTLFLSVSNGISWDYAYQPLYDMGYGFGIAFIVYITVLLFGVLNVVTSIFVESVIRSAQHHRDVIVQDKENEKYIAISHVQAVFKQVDKDESGQITAEELEFFLKEPALRKYMEALDISPEDTRLLFRLLDRDDSGVIDIEEFCQGCLRLKGNARSIDIHTLIYQIKNFLDKWAEFTDFVQDRFAQLQHSVPASQPSFMQSQSLTGLESRRLSFDTRDD